MLTSSIKANLKKGFLAILESTILILALILPSCELKSYPFTLNHWLIIYSSSGLLICLIIDPLIIKLNQWTENEGITKFWLFMSYNLTVVTFGLILFLIAWYGLGLVLLTDLIDNNYSVVKVTIFRYIFGYVYTQISLIKNYRQREKSDTESSVESTDESTDSTPEAILVTD